MPPTQLDRQPPPPAPPPPGVQVHEDFVAGEPVRALWTTRAAHVLPAGGGLRQVELQTDAREWHTAGAYMLLWQNNGAPLPIYVGGTGDLLDRINTHAINFPGWTHALALTAHDLWKGQAHQLERLLGDALLPAVVMNLVAQNWVLLPRHTPGETPWRLEEPVLVLAERILRLRTGLPVTLY